MEGKGQEMPNKKSNIADQTTQMGSGNFTRKANFPEPTQSPPYPRKNDRDDSGGGVIALSSHSRNLAKDQGQLLHGGVYNAGTGGGGGGGTDNESVRQHCRWRQPAPIDNNAVPQYAIISNFRNIFMPPRSGSGTSRPCPSVITEKHSLCSAHFTLGLPVRPSNASAGNSRQICQILNQL